MKCANKNWVSEVQAVTDSDSLCLSFKLNQIYSSGFLVLDGGYCHFSWRFCWFLLLLLYSIADFWVFDLLVFANDNSTRRTNATMTHSADDQLRISYAHSLLVSIKFVRFFFIMRNGWNGPQLIIFSSRQSPAAPHKTHTLYFSFGIFFQGKEKKKQKIQIETAGKFISYSFVILFPIAMWSMSVKRLYLRFVAEGDFMPLLVANILPSFQSTLPPHSDRIRQMAWLVHDIHIT